MNVQALQPSDAMHGMDFRAHASDWLDSNLPESFRSDVAVDLPPLEELKRFEAALHCAGLAGVVWPRAYGGYGRTLREHLIVSQEIGRRPIPESVNSIGKELAGPIILAIGTEEQKRRYLPAILEMREIWCQGFSEPGAGSDLAGLRTKAEQSAGKWTVNGQKIWTSGAYRSQRCLLLARTGSIEDRHRGMALFAVDLGAPGVTIRKIKSMDGRESFCEVFFENVQVDQNDALGMPDQGWSAAVRVLSIERATNRMHRAWRFENEFRHLIAVCKSSSLLTPLLGSSYWRTRLTAVLIDIEILKAHIETAVDDLANGRDIGARGSLFKLHWSEAHQRFATLAWELLSQDPFGDTPAMAVARKRFEAIYLASRSETIYAGTTEIQLGIIADRILELPRGR
jgi:alkylation response protein AidB-like acyl-CoA dehydrogenase